jgi:superfamily II DNA helicase RecQ
VCGHRLHTPSEVQEGVIQVWPHYFKVVIRSDSRNRPLQRDVIVAALEGDDVFVQAATGFGKSLCFQLPAIIDHGSTRNLEYGHSRDPD